MDKRFTFIKVATGMLVVLSAFGARAHVVLPAGGVTAGSDYRAEFVVGHACKGTQATTGVTVSLPAGFTVKDVPAHDGWRVERTAGSVSWTATTAAAALPTTTKGNFVIDGHVQERPGVLWFKVDQACGDVRAQWAQVPASAGDKPEFPAARLDVLAPGIAPVAVQGAWARPTVVGQTMGGIYARLTSGAGATLIGASSPVAGSVDVHEMKMDGDVMRMRAVDQLDVPAGQTVTLEPNSRHLMLQQLKAPLTAGSSVPVTLTFKDRQGRRGQVTVSVPVMMTGPAGAGAGAGGGGGHEHTH